MKITKQQLQRLIKEEAADCVKDMMAMGYSRSQAYRECDDDDDDDYDYPHYGRRRDDYYNDYYNESVSKKGKNTMKITRRQLRRVIREAMDTQLNRPFSQPDRNVEAHPEAIQLWDNVIGKNLERRGIDQKNFLHDWNEFVKFLTKFTMDSYPRDKHLTPAEASAEIESRIMQKSRRESYVDATIKTFAEILRAMNYVPDREEDLQVKLGL
jgi:hypothetical protein